MIPLVGIIIVYVIFNSTCPTPINRIHNWRIRDLCNLHAAAQSAAHQELVVWDEVMIPVVPYCYWNKDYSRILLFPIFPPLMLMLFLVPQHLIVGVIINQPPPKPLLVM